VAKKEDLNLKELDEVINVTLPKADYIILREMLEKQKSLNWIGKYVRNILFVTVGGLLSLIAFGEQLKKLFTSMFGTGG
jgi:hypothetical protein